MSDTRPLNEIDFEAYTAQERLDMLKQLLQLHVGAVQLDGGDNWCIPVIADEIKPDCSLTVQVNPYLRFQPRKLIILEPTVEIVEREKTFAEAPVFETRTVRRWFKKHVERVPTTQTKAVCTHEREHRRLIALPRGVWRVHGAFVGQRLQFPSSAGFSGDAFGPDNEIRFPDVCEPGVWISLQVKNTSKTPAPFIAMLLGNAEFAP